MTDVLDRIAAYKREDVAARKAATSQDAIETLAQAASAPRGFRAALDRTVEETGRKLGFITPLTHNCCESCNRVRVTCTGQLYMCLGQDDNADLRRALRDGGQMALDAAIAEAIGRKPKGHDFIIDRRHSDPAVSRHMNVTGG